MSLDSSFTHLHHHHSHHADLLEDFTHPSTAHLAPDEIYLAPQHQPLNPEDEDDVVPDMHAAFGIQRATQKQKEPGWRDLGLVELMNGVGLGSEQSRNAGRGQPVVGQGANATGAERTSANNANTTTNGTSAEALRARRRVEATVGARLRGGQRYRDDSMQPRRFDPAVIIPADGDDDDDDEDDEDYEDDQDDEDDDSMLWELHPNAPLGNANQLPVHDRNLENSED